MEAAVSDGDGGGNGGGDVLSPGEFAMRIAVESWALYAIGVLLVGCRLISRRYKLGAWRNLQVDDYLMVVAVCTITVDLWAMHEVAVYGSNWMPATHAAALTPDEVLSVVYGSKLALALELMTLTVIWLVKACLLLLYGRLATGVTYLSQTPVIKIVGAFCLLGYVLVVSLLLMYWCRPLDGYWRVPVEDEQCANYNHHLIFATAWDISTDVALLSIPIPLIARSNLTIKRKMMACGILGLGIIDILFAVLKCYTTFAYPLTAVYLHWYIAETCSAIYVANIPLCLPLFRALPKVLTGTTSIKDSLSPTKNNKPHSSWLRSDISRGGRNRDRESGIGWQGNHYVDPMQAMDGTNTRTNTNTTVSWVPDPFPVPSPMVDTMDWELEATRWHPQKQPSMEGIKAHMNGGIGTPESALSIHSTTRERVGD